MTHKTNIEFSGVKLGHSHRHKGAPYGGTSFKEAKEAMARISKALRGKIEESPSFHPKDSKGLDVKKELESLLVGRKGRSKTGKPDSNYSEITSVSITDNDIIIKFKSGYFTGLTSLELE